MNGICNVKYQSDIFKIVINPEPESFKRNPIDFLQSLSGPTWFVFEGHNTDKNRVVTTLLHGNEPSGLFALLHWGVSQIKPSVTLHIFVLSIEAACTSPHFTQRNHEGKDQNRCFSPPYHNTQGKRAEALIKHLQHLQPEALLDLHNSSGRGPAYSVSTLEDVERKWLTTLFSNEMILTHLCMGTLMEAAENICPTITVECGGSDSDIAHQIGCDGLTRFAVCENLYNPINKSDKVKIYKHPRRLELTINSSVSYGINPKHKADLTLPSNADKWNFEPLKKGKILGELGDKGISCLTAKNSKGEKVLQTYFSEENNKLILKKSLRLFMVTTQTSIAESDCLFYFVPI